MHPITIPVTITASEPTGGNATLLTLDCPYTTIGTQYDSMAQRLEFTRPEGYADHDLTLRFSSVDSEYPDVDLGTDNIFQLTRFLTSELSLRMQIILHKDKQILSSNIINFTFRASLHESIPDAYDYAFANVLYDSDENSLVFYNFIGNPVDRVKLPEYSGHGDGDNTG